MTISFLTFNLGSIIGCIVAAIMMEKFHPKYALLGFGCLGFAVGTACFFLNEEAEAELLVGEEELAPTEWSSELKAELQVLSSTHFF